MDDEPIMPYEYDDRELKSYLFTLTQEAFMAQALCVALLGWVALYCFDVTMGKF